MGAEFEVLGDISPGIRQRMASWLSQMDSAHSITLVQLPLCGLELTGGTSTVDMLEADQ